MLIMLDESAPIAARKALEKEGEVVLFQTNNICYDAISGHPDIFFFQHPNGLIIAPNTPEKYKKLLSDKGIPFITGNSEVGEKYPCTAIYNALHTSHGVLHNRVITDDAIKNHFPLFIDCKQGYVRCTTIQTGNLFITSDKGIERVLLNNNLNVIYACPENISLKGFRHGFFGGCCGLCGKKLYICGSLREVPGYKSLAGSIESQGFEIKEICSRGLHDVGGILFLY